MKIILCLAICVAGILANDEPELQLVGAEKTPITDQREITELEQKISVHLTALAAGKPNSKLELLQTKSATHQFVAGSSYELVGNVKENDGATVECTIRFWEQPWSSYSQLKVECGEEKRQYEWVVGTLSRRKRNPQLVFGGLQEVSASTLPQLTSKLNQALVKLGTEQGTTLQLRKILSAQSQVIAGVRYVITAELAAGSEVKTCTAEIIEPVSGNDQTNISCDDKKYSI